MLLIFGVPSVLVFQPLGANATPAALLGAGLMLWWVSARLLGPHPAPSPVRPVHWALAFFAVSILLSYWHGNFRAPSPLELRSADRSLILLIGWAGIALAVADGIAARRNLDRLLRLVVIAAAFMSVVGMFQFFIGFDLASHVRFPGLTAKGDIGLIQQRSIFRRVTGTTSHPLEFGVVLATVLPLAIHFVVASPRRRRLHILCLVLIAAAIPMSLSRSATVGTLAAGMVLFAGWSRSQRRRALVIVPMFAVVLRLLVPGLLGTIKSLFLNWAVDPSISGRTDDYAQVGKYFAESPILGRGFGTFVPEIYPLLDNQYLGHLMETGVVGLTALLALFVVGFFCGRGARLRSEDEETRHLGQALAAALAVPAVTFATFDGFGFSMVTTLTFLLLGASACLWRMVVQERGFVVPSRWSAQEESDSHPRPPATPIGIS